MIEPSYNPTLPLLLKDPSASLPTQEFAADDEFRHGHGGDSLVVRTLIDRALTGVGAARGDLAERILKFRPLVYKNLKYRLGGARAAASAQLDDCMQDLIVGLLLGERPILGQYEPALGTFPGFMKIVIWRWVGRWAERLHRSKLVSGVPETADERRFHEDLERSRYADAILNRLRAEFNARDASIFDRLFVRLESRQEVAAAEGMNVDALHKWYSRKSERVAEIARELERTVKKASSPSNKVKIR